MGTIIPSRSDTVHNLDIAQREFCLSSLVTQYLDILNAQIVLVHCSELVELYGPLPKGMQSLI